MYEYTRLIDNDYTDSEPNYENEIENEIENAIEMKRTNTTSTQTDFDRYTSFKALPESVDLEFEKEDVYFKHLVFANQTYFEHFYDAIKYSLISLKASIYFFCHAFWPDLFAKTGSDTIHSLSETIYEKYHKRIQEIIEEKNISE